MSGKKYTKRLTKFFWWGEGWGEVVGVRNGGFKSEVYKVAKRLDLKCSHHKKVMIIM